MNLKTKWEKEYIKDLDLTKIKWITLNNEELRDFFDKNYIDKENWQYVSNQDDWNNPIGLKYLTFQDINLQYTTLLGVVKNNINKNTIVAAMIYEPSCFIFKNQEIPVTFICTIETNSYFRNQGIYKQLCNEILNSINSEQHIIVTRETDMGKKCNVLKTLKETLLKNGFNKTVWENNIWNYSNQEFYKTIMGKDKKTKRKSKGVK